MSSIDAASPAAAGEQAPRKNLAQRARSAVIWHAALNLFRDVLQFAVMLVLVRLLPPEAYGQFGLVNAIIGFVAILSFQSFLAHTLQVRDERELDYQSHFTAGGVIQLGLFALTNLVAVGMRVLDWHAEVAPMVHAMSITFVLEWPTEVRRRMLERALQIKRHNLLHAIGLVVSSLVAIVMAFAGAGAYALLLPGLIVAVPFIYDLFVTQKWRPTWEWNRERYAAALRFGFTRMASGLAIRGRTLLEAATLTALVGFAQFGFLGRAIGLAQLLCHRLAFQLMYAVYPVLANLPPDTPQYRKASALVLASVAWTVVPIAVLISALAEPVVALLYGSAWARVTGLLPWTLTAAALSAVGHAAYMLLLGHNRQRLCLFADILLLVGTGAALLLAGNAGIEVYVVALVAVQGVVVLPTLVWLKRDGAIATSGITDAVLPPLVCAAIGYGASMGAFAALDRSPSEGVLYACAYGMLFGLAYLAALRVLFARPLRELVLRLPGGRRLSRVLALEAAP